MSAEELSGKPAHSVNFESIRHNTGVLYQCRVYTSIVAGFVAGILGLTNVVGFLMYFVAMAVVRPSRAGPETADRGGAVLAAPPDECCLAELQCPQWASHPWSGSAPKIWHPLPADAAPPLRPPRLAPASW